MSKPILLVSGIPGSGKSSFARWLGKNKGYLHVDFDHGDLQRHNLEGLFYELESSGSQQFIIELVKRDVPVCLDWGFPPHCLRIVRRLVDAGVEPWWFDANPEVAKKHFLSRGDVSETAFDEQIANIKAAQPAIMELFGEHVISTLNADGTHVSGEQIYAEIFK
jgi:hypothetical protein